MWLKYTAHRCEIHLPPLSYLREGAGGSRGGWENFPLVIRTGGAPSQFPGISGISGISGPLRNLLHSVRPRRPREKKNEGEDALVTGGRPRHRLCLATRWPLCQFPRGRGGLVRKTRARAAWLAPQPSSHLTCSNREGECRIGLPAGGPSLH